MKGQAALIVLLVVAVALGFGLSIISQSTTDVRISQQEEESARAFNAAEAGIEEALQKLSTIAIGIPQTIGGLTGDVSGSYVVNAATSLESVFVESDTVQVNLLNHDPSLNVVTVNWVKADSSVENPGCNGESNTAASLAVTVVKGLSGGYSRRNFAYNSCTGLTNGFTDVATAGDNDYFRKITIPVEADDELIRIRPVYNQASILVYGNVDLPSQGYAIASSAQVLNQAQDQSRAAKSIEVTRTEPATPAIFDYVLFSGTNLVK